jgi:hypothetical protein
VVGIILFRLLVGCAAVLAMVAGATTAARATPVGVPVGTFTGCPRDVRPLPPRLADYEPTVKRTVLAFVRTRFQKYAQSPPSSFVGARVRRVQLVRHWLPSGWIKIECGLLVWRQSVAALVYFPRLDKPHNPIGHCNACAQLTFLLSRTGSGWTVWGRY